MQTLKIGQGEGWCFVGGRWQDGPAEYAVPPDVFSLRMAIHTAAAYGDVAVECDFQAGNAATGAGDAGIILRAQVTTPEAHDSARCGALPARQNARHHYWVHTPWVGQTTRAKHFWLAISKMDASGWARNLALQVVPGVPAETHRWYRLRVEAQGPHIRTWVDGVPGPAVTDDTYGAGDAGDTPGLHTPNGTKVVQTWRSGCVGMAGYGEFRCKELRVAADQAALPLDWSSDPPQIAWFKLLPDFRGVTDRQKPHNLRRLPGGTLVLTFDDREVNYTTRSHDHGATWDTPQVIPADRVGALHVTREGRLWACDFVGGRVSPERINRRRSDVGAGGGVPVDRTVAR